MADRIVRIGCASGFWGDSAMAAPQLVRRGAIDYLVADYLAEITMSIMARMRAKDPQSGYAVDFVTATMGHLVAEIAERRIKVVTNAGGVNPGACAAALRAVAERAGVRLRVAVVLGDDLSARTAALRQADVRGIGCGEPLPERLLSLNAYLGAAPIAAALAAGADVVITGRCVDSALALGPLLHEFGWRLDDWDRLAAGSLAGHIIECGAQATGGLFTDWDQVPGWEDIGYPVAECAADGTFVLAKPPGTGGLVSRGTVAEQLLYEIGDPAAYLLPDVTCDFTAVRLEEIGPDRVRVSGARGRPPPATYKASATYMDGWRAVAHLTIGGIDAAAKARRTAGAILARTRRMFGLLGLADYRASDVEVLGAEAMYGPHACAGASREVVLKIAVAHAERAALELFSREVAPAGTSMAPGTTGYFGGRPKVQPVVRLHSCLVPKSLVEVAVAIDGEFVPVAEAPAWPAAAARPAGPDPAAAPAFLPPGPTAMVPLVRLAWGRSGDKGDDSNIGIIARRPEYLPAIRRALTPAAVKAYMSHLVEGEVERFEVPGIDAVNFLLRGALGGGGTASLRNDPQGKAYAQMLLEMPVEVPAAWGLG